MIKHLCKWHLGHNRYKPHLHTYIIVEAQIKATSSGVTMYNTLQLVSLVWHGSYFNLQVIPWWLALLEITVGHWPFSNFANQNPFWSVAVHFQ